MAGVEDRKLSPLEAYDGIMLFASEKGDSALPLALHAAVPQSFRPDFLHLVRLNFVPEAANEPWVEADVLLAPFCERLGGGGYYRFDVEARQLLLQNLELVHENEAESRVERVARFVLEYVDRSTTVTGSGQDRLTREYLEVQRWVGFSYVYPDLAAQQLAAALEGVAPEDTVARAHVGELISSLAAPLYKYPQLLTYAAGLEALSTGRAAAGKELLERFGKGDVQVGSVKLRPPKQVLQDFRVAARATVGPEKTARIGRAQVFVSYSRKDKRWRDDFDTHLRPYLGDGSIISWSGAQITPGSNWLAEIKSALTDTKVAVLLVTPDLLASDFTNEQLGPLLKEAKHGGVRILWVPIRDSAYKQTLLKNYQAVLDPDKPLAGMTKVKRDQAWVTISETVARAVNPPKDPLPGRQPISADSKARVFVSHSTGDRPFARKLVKALRGHNLNVWIDEQELQVGDSIVAGVSEGIKNASYLVTVLSKASLESRWVQAELNATLMEELSGKGVVVLPVLIEDCELPTLLRDRVYADFRDDFEVGLQRLVAVFQQERESTADVTPKAASAAAPCSKKLSSITLADLRRRISNRMDRSEVAELWFVVLGTAMENDMAGRQLSECVISLLDKAKNRNKLPLVIEEICQERPDLANPQ